MPGYVQPQSRVHSSWTSISNCLADLLAAFQLTLIDCYVFRAMYLEARAREYVNVALSFNPSAIDVPWCPAGTDHSCIKDI